MFSFLCYIFRHDSSSNGVYGVIPFYTPIHIYTYIYTRHLFLSRPFILYLASKINDTYGRERWSLLYFSASSA